MTNLGKELSLVLQTMHHGNKALVRNPNRIIYFEQKENVAVLIDTKTKKVINIAYFNGGISSLDEEHAEEAEKAREAKEKSDKAVNDVFQDTKPIVVTKGRSKTKPDDKTKKFEKPENLDDAHKDFESLPLTDIKEIPIGRTGVLPDGRQVTVRSKSDDGRPTLEIYDRATKERLKLRYGKK